jgi:hypothetical protein
MPKQGSCLISDTAIRAAKPKEKVHISTFRLVNNPIKITQIYLK